VAALPVTPFQMNQYMLGCKVSGEAAIIDAGDTHPQGWIDCASEQGVSVKYLLQTHAHIDHVAGLADTKDLLPDAPIYMHPLDIPWLDKLQEQADMFGIDVRTDSPTVDVELQDGQTFKVGDLELSTIHTPGHSPGHVCFHVASEKLLFVGDLIFQGSIGRTDLPMCDGEAMKASIALVSTTLPGETTLLPGHMGKTTLEYEKLNNPFL
jgi:glyoxylase-like metal-dependent hydrolase (beta-lactamase superfamily II)